MKEYYFALILFITLTIISGCSKEPVTHAIITEPTTEHKNITKAEEEMPPPIEQIEKKETTKTVKEKNESKKIQKTKKEWIVTIENIRLNPQQLKIKKGDKVIWKHKDKPKETGPIKHMLYSYSEKLRSPVLEYGQSFNHTFNKTGTHYYYDVFYKDRLYMKGKIIVSG